MYFLSITTDGAIECGRGDDGEPLSVLQEDLAPKCRCLSDNLNVHVLSITNVRYQIDFPIKDREVLKLHQSSIGPKVC
jgi:hypothetical protein